MTETTAAPVVTSHEEVLALADRELGPTAWTEVTQEHVDGFGRSVHDWHWAHNDPERAARGPFGSAIAHAHMTLATLPHFRESLVEFASGECMFYGYDRVRFPTAVPVGGRIRASATVVSAEPIAGGEQVTLDVRVEVEGQDRPACVARAVWRHYDIEPPD